MRRRHPTEFGPKTRTSRRTVELDAATVDLLQQWRQQLDSDGLPAGIDDWMFCNTAGRYLNPQSISQLFDRIIARTDIPRVRFHDLRHTHASLLIADGEDVKVVSERLGHAHPAFTIHTYQHLVPGMSAAAAERFAKADRQRRSVDVHRAITRESPAQWGSARRGR